MRKIVRYIGRDLERVQVLALLAGRLLPYGPRRSGAHPAAARKVDTEGVARADVRSHANPSEGLPALHLDRDAA
jgi:hypothetical protein